MFGTWRNSKFGYNPAAEDHTPIPPAVILPPSGVEAFLMQPDLAIKTWIYIDTGSVVSMDTLDKYSATLFLFEGEYRSTAAACNRAEMDPYKSRLSLS